MRERAASAAAPRPLRSPGAAVGLRALRASPALIDDAAVVRLLRSSGLAPDEARWARAWLVCSQATLMAEPRYGYDPTPELPFDPARVSTPKGLGDTARRHGVVDALLGAGVLRLAAAPASDAERGAARVGRLARGQAGAAPDARGPAGWVTWAPGVCVAHAAALALDWPHVVAACAREPATLLVARTLAEFLVPLDAWAMVPRRDLVERTGYQQKQVRVALRRLAASGLIETDGESGRIGRYRFTAGALGPRWAGAPEGEVAPFAAGGFAAAESGRGGVRPSAAPDRERTTGAERARSSPGPVPERERPEAGQDDAGLELVVGGVSVRVAPGASLDIDAGMRARLAPGPDGRPRLTIAS